MADSLAQNELYTMSATKEDGATLAVGKWLVAAVSSITAGLALYALVGMWNTTQQNGDLLLQVKTVVDAGKEARLKSEAQNNEAHSRIEQKLEKVATVREVEEIKTRVMAIETELRRLDVEIIKLKGK